MLACLRHLIARDVSSTLRHPAQALTPLAFFAVAVSLFPLAVGADKALLLRLAPGVVWVVALLSLLLGLERLFEDDARDGSLELMAMSPQPLELVALGKVCGFWLTACLPLILLSPVLGLQLGMSSEALVRLALSLLVGSPALCLIGAVAAALMLSVQRTSLLALLVLPVAVPVVIFGSAAAGAYDAAMLEANLSLLGACSLLAAVTAPWATAAALKLGVESA